MSGTADGLDRRATTAPLGQALLLVGDFWSMRIISSIALGARRFQDIRDELGVSDPVLSRRLSRLSEAGVIEPRPYQDRPVRNESCLTDASKALWIVIVAMWSWDRRWISERHRLSGIDLRHRHCANLTRPVFSRGECGAIEVTWVASLRRVPVQARRLTDDVERPADLFRRPGLVLPHRSCGQQIQPQLTCNCCNRPLSRETIRFEHEGQALAASWRRPRLASTTA